METFYFGDSTRSLFGVLHEPARAPAEPRVVVVCAPLWREGVRAHRVLRQLGARLAKDGLSVLRFDYSGAGDSAGESEHGDVDVWLEDIDAAIDQARRAKGVARVTLLGLRFGATLAAFAAARRADVEQLVLWEPVHDGESYLQAGRADQRAWADAYAIWRRLPRAALAEADHDDQGFQIMGYRVPEVMRRSIAAVSLTTLPRTPPRVLVVERSVPDEASGLWKALAARGAQLQHEVIAEAEIWKQHRGEGAAGARQTLDVIATWLTGSAP